MVWLLVGGIAIVFCITASTLLAIWALTATERDDVYGGDDDGES